MNARRRCSWWAAALSASALFGCSGAREGLESASLPADVRPDYEVFAQRCSKCHSLARPLNSGITDDDWWGRYVAKMRRMPASGISHEDAAQILRFLHWYSADQLKKKSERTSSARALEPLR